MPWPQVGTEVSAYSGTRKKPLMTAMEGGEGVTLIDVCISKRAQWNWFLLHVLDVQVIRQSWNFVHGLVLFVGSKLWDREGCVSGPEFYPFISQVSMFDLSPSKSSFVVTSSAALAASSVAKSSNQLSPRFEFLTAPSWPLMSQVSRFYSSPSKSPYMVSSSAAPAALSVPPSYKISSPRFAFLTETPRWEEAA